ncbi:MAG: DnaJ domain-containing protein [Chloroflexota bacterium]
MTRASHAGRPRDTMVRMSADRDMQGPRRGPSARPEIIATAYRALARSHHPDVSREPDAEARMAEINAAWMILRDADRRAAYDREHHIVGGVPDPRGANPFPPAQPRARTATATAPAPRSSAYADAAEQASAGDPSAWRRGRDGEGAAGPPPGRPMGSVLRFGRHIGWSLGEIARADPGYLQWLAARPEGQPYLDEINALLAPLLRTADGRAQLNAFQGPVSKRPRFGR